MAFAGTKLLLVAMGVTGTIALLIAMMLVVALAQTMGTAIRSILQPIKEIDRATYLALKAEEPMKKRLRYEYEKDCARNYTKCLLLEGT